MKFNNYNVESLELIPVNDRSAGIDIEKIASAAKMLRDDFMTRSEQRVLNSKAIQLKLSEEEACTIIWSAKECYLKAAGKRLSDMLRVMFVDLDDDKVYLKSEFFLTEHDAKVNYVIHGGYVVTSY